MKVSLPAGRRGLLPKRRRMFRYKKFLRKYPRGLGSPDKVYAFKRLTIPFKLYNKVVGGNPTLAPIQPDGPDMSMEIGSPDATYQTDVYGVGVAMSFRLNDVIQSSEFTSLFDQYKISGVKARITWNCTQGEIAGGIPAPRVMYSVDEDDKVIPEELTIRAKNSTKFHQFGQSRPLTIYIKPRVRKNVQSVTGTATAPGKTWLDCSYPLVPHYGLKMYINDLWLPNDASLDARNLFNIDLTYYIKTKGVQ